MELDTICEFDCEAPATDPQCERGSDYPVPEGFLYYPAAGAYYRIISKPSSKYIAAMKTCQSLNATFVEPETPEEGAAVKRLRGLDNFALKDFGSL